MARLVRATHGNGRDLRTGFMPKSRGRKPKLKGHSQSPRPSPMPALQSERRSKWKLVGIVAGGIATLLALVTGPDFFRQMYADTAPVVHASASEDASPFNLPFDVSNRSWLFTVTDGAMLCGGDFYGKTGKMIAHNVWGIGPQDGPMVIPPNSTVHPFCEIGSPEGMVRFSIPPSGAHILVQVQYRTELFGWKSDTRRTAPIEMTWYTKTAHPHWIEGKILK